MLRKRGKYVWLVRLSKWDLNKINLDFAGCIANLLAVYQLQILSSSVFVILFNSSKSLCAVKAELSSAKSTCKAIFDALCKSLMNITNKITPKIEPCNTEMFISNHWNSAYFHASYHAQTHICTYIRQNIYMLL